MNNRNLKIIKAYGIAFLCIICYFLLENSTIIPELVEYANKLRHKGFATFFITGLINYGLLFIGISIIVIWSFMLIREKTKK